MRRWWQGTRAAELRRSADELGAQLRASAERLDVFAAALARQIDQDEGDNGDDERRRRPAAGL